MEAKQQEIARLLRIGLDHYGKEDAAAAVGAWNAVLALDPGNPLVFQDLGEALLLRGGRAEDTHAISPVEEGPYLASDLGDLPGDPLERLDPDLIATLPCRCGERGQLEGRNLPAADRIEDLPVGMRNPLPPEQRLRLFGPGTDRGGLVCRSSTASPSSATT